MPAFPWPRRFERGSFFLFEPATWEVTRRDELTVQFDQLEPAARGPLRAPAAAEASGQGPAVPTAVGAGA